MHKKHLYFEGRCFTRDENTGYYLCSTKSSDGKRKRMHVYVWEWYNGPVPEGHHIHHIDGDKANNSITNLELMKGTEHMSLHWRKYASGNHQRIIDNLDKKARPKAIEWHKSRVGRDWHKKHYNAMKQNLHRKYQFTCQHCGRAFETTQIRAKYCSANCRSAARRASGIDNVIKYCQDCGGEYIGNKYAKTKYCKLCKDKKHPRNRKSRSV